VIGPSLALSCAYVRLVFASPLGWIALAGTALSTYRVSLEVSQSLLGRGLRFQLVVVGLCVLNDSLFVTWGFLL